MPITNNIPSIGGLKYPPTNHSHNVDDINGLQNELNTIKNADVKTHSHTSSEISDLSTTISNVVSSAIPSNDWELLKSGMGDNYSYPKITIPSDYSEYKLRLDIRAISNSDIQYTVIEFVNASTSTPASLSHHSYHEVSTTISTKTDNKGFFIATTKSSAPHVIDFIFKKDTDFNLLNGECIIMSKTDNDNYKISSKLVNCTCNWKDTIMISCAKSTSSYTYFVRCNYYLYGKK